MRLSKMVPGVALALSLQACGSPEGAPVEAMEAVGTSAQAARLSIHNADPTVIRVDSTYVSAETSGNRIYVRTASSVAGLSNAPAQLVFSNPNGWAEVWAPEIIKSGTTYYIYFTAGAGSAHRMYVIQSQSAASGYSAPAGLALPDNKWAIDGTAFVYKGQWYFVWSGWVGDSNGEQTIFLARMSSPTQVTGARFVISQPREAFEKVDVNPPCRVNEGPEPIIDPSGQLHIVYSTNGSWDANYCLADLRLKLGGDATYVWDWYKSNGCLFGANKATLMSGWGSHAVRQGRGPPLLRAPQWRPEHEPARGPHLPPGLPRREQDGQPERLLGRALLVLGQLPVVGQHHVHPGHGQEHGLEPEVLRVGPPGP